jgi:hypothetical protein
MTYGVNDPVLALGPPARSGRLAERQAAVLAALRRLAEPEPRATVVK